jgi:hypothetical protein
MYHPFPRKDKYLLIVLFPAHEAMPVSLKMLAKQEFQNK